MEVREIKDRIKKIRLDNHMTQAQFGDRIGVKANTITNYEIGIRTPSDAIILSICRVFYVDEKWLRSGEGEPYISKSVKLTKYAIDIAKSDDSLIKDIIEVYMELGDTEKETLRVVAEKMAKKIRDGD